MNSSFLSLLMGNSSLLMGTSFTKPVTIEIVRFATQKNYRIM